MKSSQSYSNLPYDTKGKKNKTKLTLIFTYREIKKYQTVEV